MHRGHSDNNTRIDSTTTGAPHDDLTQPPEDMATDLAMTHCTGHIANYSNIEALQIIDPEITVDHIHNHPTNPQGMNLTNQTHTSAG